MHINEMMKVCETDPMMCETMKMAKAMALNTIHELGGMHAEHTTLDETDLKRIALSLEIIQSVKHLGK